MVRKDHGGMEYRRMTSGEDDKHPAVIRGDRKPLNKRLANKQLAAAAAAAAAASATAATAAAGSPPLSAHSPVPLPEADGCQPDKPPVKGKKISVFH